IAPTTPIELDVSAAPGHPVRREPLLEPTTPTDAITVS
ncbi:MAG: hypothetical protein RLZZ461_388, partial [Planctomycetota bacterium]